VNIDYWSTGIRGDIVQLPLVEAVQQWTTANLRVVGARQTASRAKFEALGLPVQFTTADTKLQQLPKTALAVTQVRGNLKKFYVGQSRLVHITMASPWDQFYIDIPRRSGSKILLTVHDAEQHLGEESKLLLLLEKRLFGMVDAFAVLSAYSGEVLRRRLGDKAEIHVVSPGLVMNSSAPGPAKMAPTTRPLKFLFFGRIHKYKGLDILLEAWELLKSQNAPPMQLTVAGSGDLDNCRAALARNPEITFMEGWTSDETMAQLFAENDVNLLPYRESYASATSLAGMWAGMPTIATPIGAFREQLFHDQNALIMQDISAQSLAAAMAQVAGSADLFNTLAQGAHRVANSLSAPNVAANWVRVYKKILK
jgi:glycosyltransferase involved in cell wall biosynthesis